MKDSAILHFYRGRKKRITLEYAILIFAISALYSLVLTPLQSWAYNDVLIRDMGLSILFETLLDVLNYLFFWVSFAYFLWMTARFSIRECRFPMLVCLGAILFRYGTALLTGYLLNGFPLWASFLEDTLPYLTIDVLLDVAIFGIGLLLICFLFDFPTAARRHGDRSWHTPLSAHLPFKGLFAPQNPLWRITLIVSALPSLSQILYRLIYDIFFYGAPRDWIDLLWILVYYLGDLLTAFVGFLVTLLLLNRAYLREEKAYLDYSAD